MADITRDLNTLTYDALLCVGCGLCSTVCPHGVFAQEGRKARLVRYGACIECGACQRNCPTGAIEVDSGVGCAQAFIMSALRGKSEPCCGPDDEDSGACCC
jgi:NAD-dependent dihydropyrimidine dehydrogenase PreA subunit